METGAGVFLPPSLFSDSVSLKGGPRTFSFSPSSAGELIKERLGASPLF